MKPNSLKHLRQLLLAVKYVWNSSQMWTIANVILTFVSGVLPLVVIYMIKLIIDQVTLNQSSPEAWTTVVWLVIATGGLYLLSAVCASIGSLVSGHQSELVKDYMLDILHKKSLTLDLEHYEDSEYHDILHRAIQDAPYRPQRILYDLVTIAQSTVSLSIVAVMLFMLHWSVPLVLLIVTLPGVFVKLKYADILFSWKRTQTLTERKASYYNRILTSQAFVKEIKLFGLGYLFIERYKGYRNTLRTELLGLAKRRTLLEITTQIFSTLGIFGSYAFIAYRALHGNITIGDLVLFFLVFQRGLSFLKNLLTGLADLYENNLFLKNLYEFLRLETKIKNTSQPQPIPNTKTFEIRFENVSFSYPNSQRKALENINLTIDAGKTIALVGENGAGKTTIIKLLCRLYEPTEGNIYLNNINIKNFDVNQYRQKLSVIFQDYVLYNMTAGENIWLGNIKRQTSDNKVQESAKKSGIDKVIEKLPNKYETMLGRVFENSEQLSVGEWQRLALARAFFRDADIIVLDEPTASLDVQNEYEIFRQFGELTKDKTAIIVSHRFATVRVADYIFVLSGKNIAEQGTHTQLMQINGKYAYLFNMQAQNYQM